MNAKPNPVRIIPSLTVAELLAQHPAAAAVFLRLRMACPGCPMSPFETLAEVAAAYRIDRKHFLNQLRLHYGRKPS